MACCHTAQAPHPPNGHLTRCMRAALPWAAASPVLQAAGTHGDAAPPEGRPERHLLRALPRRALLRCTVLQRAPAPPERGPLRTGPGPLASPNLRLAGIHGHAMQPGSARGTSCSDISPPPRPAARCCSALLPRLGGATQRSLKGARSTFCSKLSPAALCCRVRYCAAWEGSFEDRSSTLPVMRVYISSTSSTVVSKCEVASYLRMHRSKLRPSRSPRACMH